MSEAIEQAQDENPIVQKMKDLITEYEAQHRRMKQRAAQVQKLEGESPLVKELFQEMTDTVLSLQTDALRAVLEGIENMSAVSDGASMLLEPDANVIGVALDHYEELLKMLIEQPGQKPEFVAQLQERLTECTTALELIDEITVGGDDEADDDGDGDGGSQPAN
jgi:hypothetical protein